MEIQEKGAQIIAGQYRMKKAVVVTVGLLLFFVVTVVAYVFCTLHLKNKTQEILNTQRDMQQAWVDKSTEAIRAWRNGLVEQSRFISTAEMFRLFAVDVNNLGPDGPSQVADPNAEKNENEAVVSLAEQRSYMQGILKDFVARRQWVDARVITGRGGPLVAPDMSLPLVAVQEQLARRANEAKALTFGPVRPLGKTFVMDIVDPLYEVLGRGDPKPVAFLLLTVPVDKALMEFLEYRQEQGTEFLPGILNRGAEGWEYVLWRDGKLTISPVKLELETDASLPFKRRQALSSGEEVYSLGSRLADLNWYVVAEMPGAFIDNMLEGEARQIYGIGVLCSLGVALLLAFVWASVASRSHQATARHFKQLYTVIRQQKLMLDSINASLQVGLLLVGANGRVLVSNAAFCEIARASEGALAGADLGDVLQEKAAETLCGGMERVSESGRSDSIEISLDYSDGSRLYRVTLFPFEDQQDEVQEEGGRSANGCVGIFQDITEFRRRAEEARRRQQSLIGALVRAIESVDVNLIGHSQKMEQMVELLGSSMRLDDKDRETLRLAARLSQVGKIFVPHHLLTKKGKLTPEEMQEVMRAPEYAYNALRDLQFGLPVPEAVYQMGERMDGTGEPRHLKGEEIILNARILAIVNAYCSMVSARSYRAGMDPVEAVKLLSQNPAFDPAIVEKLGALPVEAVRKIIGTYESGEKDTNKKPGTP
jgi:HD-GYP domain-containing protein (c-di-GMP phosphodiesterase class II)